MAPSIPPLEEIVRAYICATKSAVSNLTRLHGLAGSTRRNRFCRVVPCDLSAPRGQTLLPHGLQLHVLPYRIFGMRLVTTIGQSNEEDLYQNTVDSFSVFEMQMPNLV